MITIMRWLNDKLLLWRLKLLLRQFPEPPPAAFQMAPEKAARALRLRDRLVATIHRLENGADPGAEVSRLKNEFLREKRNR